ncbi:MAG: 1-deoxy-D-xylulose-5-phosphate reductoisomerase, partial [Erythrobacter sp. 34-65-8]
FEAPDEQRFPATRLSRQAAEAGGAMPAVLNAANEVAVAAFLAGHLSFTRIAVIVEETMARYAPSAPAALAEVLAVDREARAQAQGLLETA